MDRREVIKNLALLPLGGSMLPLGPGLGATQQNKPKGPILLDENIYQSIGVEPIINCRGTFTIIGGSKERPEVHKAMEAASQNFVQYDELALGIGERLAELTKSEWGIITSGCAAAMKHATAACVTGGNPEKLLKIPDLRDLDKTEVIIPRYSRNAYDHAIRNIGVTLIPVSTAEELATAINPRTAMIYLTSGPSSATGQPLSLEVIAEIAKPKTIPILMDAAAENLTIPSIHFERGATMVAYSGGKAICGPQCAGLLLGKKDILMSAWQASSPHHGPGRDNKIGREEMMGMLAAVEAWTKRDHEAEWNTWLSWLDIISNEVLKVKGITTSIKQPRDLNNRAPVLNIAWNPSQLHITGAEVAEELGRNKPRMAVGSWNDEGLTSIEITPNQMQAGEEIIVGDRIFKVLSQTRAPKPLYMATPASNLGGRWEVNITFFSSESKHKWHIEQDENWIQGLHESDFGSQDIFGTIEGDRVKLHSVFRAPGDHITYMFSGNISGDNLQGTVYMGEYLTADFKAQKIPYLPKKEEIIIPGGPPLAT